MFDSKDSTFILISLGTGPDGLLSHDQQVNLFGEIKVSEADVNAIDSEIQGLESGLHNSSLAKQLARKLDQLATDTEMTQSHIAAQFREQSHFLYYCFWISVDSACFLVRQVSYIYLTAVKCTLSKLQRIRGIDRPLFGAASA